MNLGALAVVYHNHLAVAAFDRDPVPSVAPMLAVVPIQLVVAFDSSQWAVVNTQEAALAAVSPADLRRN